MAARSPDPRATGARQPASRDRHPPAAKVGLRARLVDWALLAGPGLIWGTSFLFIAEGLEALAPDGITFLRIVIGFGTLALVPAARAPINPHDRRGTALLGVLWLAFPLSMFPYAEQRVSSALTGMLNGAMPLFAAIVASLIARALPSRAVATGLLVGLTGAVLVAWPSLGQGRSSTIGVLLILAAVVCYGVAVNLARPLQQRSGALPVVWRAQAVALLLTAPLGLPDLFEANWTLRAALSMLALGALGTGAAYVLLAVAAGRIGAARASATTFLIPPVALALGVLVRGEHVALLSAVGAGVCLLGAWLIRRSTLRGH